MARLKNKNWNCGTEYTDGSCKAFDVHHCQLATLMDIRDLLSEIKTSLAPLRHLECHNFLAIPRTLSAIKRNTAKKRRKK